LRAAEALEVVTARFGQVITSIGLTVGTVGVVPGEEPVLTAFAPRLDLVAPRIRDALGGGRAHRRRYLWLPLPDGTYLASVVDPFLPFEGSAEEVAGLVRAGLVAHAFSGQMKVEPAGVRLELDVYARRSDLKKLLSLVRSGVEEGAGGQEAR
jgi:hypothetical protein